MSVFSQDQSAGFDFVEGALGEIAPKLVIDTAYRRWGCRPNFCDISLVPFGAYNAQNGQRVMREEEFRDMVLSRGYDRFGVACLYDFLQHSTEVPVAWNDFVLFFAGVWLVNPHNGMRFVAYTEKRVDPKSEASRWVLGVHCTHDPYWFSRSRVVG